MKVAIDKIKITPKNYIGMQMAGYEIQDPCSGLLDDIHAHGVLIKSSNADIEQDYLLLLSLDLLKVPLSIANYIKKKICSEIDNIKPEQILIHSIHTHSAPDLTGEFYYTGSFLKGAMFGMNRNDKYVIYLIERIVQLTKTLFSKLIPCKITWKKKIFNPELVINRRHPTITAKPELGVILFKNIENNEKIGLIINYACHPVTLSYENSKMSADYPGRIIHHINELTNNKIKAVYFNGPSADLNPITTCGTDYEKLEQDLKLVYDQHGTYEHTEKLGKLLAKEALELAESIENNELYEIIDISCVIRDFSVPFKDFKYFGKPWFQNKLFHSLKKLIIIPVLKTASANANFPAFTITSRRFRTMCHTKIQYIKIKTKSNSHSKELNIITTPGELIEALGKKLLKFSPIESENTFIFQNSNDWIGYLLSKYEYTEYGGYEPIASFSPVIGEIVVSEVLNLFNELDL
ncbi:MAG: hypothetical protein ACFFAO_13300 [Candidatus Hermodarchaeota archaeon]